MEHAGERDLLEPVDIALRGATLLAAGGRAREAGIGLPELTEDAKELVDLHPASPSHGTEAD
jgi:hypothetical protein